MESPPGAPAAPIDRTLPEASSPVAQALRGALPPAPAPAAPEAPPPAPIDARAARSGALRAGLGIGAVVALLGAGAVLAVELPHPARNPLPFPAEQLSGHFASVSRAPRPATYVERARAYSANAARCGGLDLYELARDADGFYAIEELATIIRDTDRAQAFLRCGKRLTELASTAYAIAFDDHADPVIAIGTSVDKIVLDPTLVPRPHSGFSELYCRAPEGAKCDRGTGAARLAGAPYWLFGMADTLERYGDSLGDGPKLDADDAEKIERLARDVAPYARTTIGGPNAKFYFGAFELRPHWGSEVEAARRDLEKQIKETQSYWATGTPYGVEGEARLEIVSKSGHDAREVLSALRDYRSALKHVDLSEVPVFGSAARTRYSKAISAMFKRALTDAEPVREDELITYDLRIQAEPDDGPALYRFEVESDKQELHYARLVYALIDGQDPDETTLRAIGGRELWLSVYHGLRNRSGRVSPPPAEEVPDLADVPVPGGGQLGARAPSGGREYRFRVERDDAVAIVNELKQLLTDAGWAVRLDSIEAGPNYVCERDARRLSVSVGYVGRELLVTYRPLD